MRWLIGPTGRAFFDVWSIAHFAFWVFIGSALWGLRVPRLYMLLACLAVAYAWEVFERFAEPRWPQLWLNPESWRNSWLSDPLMCILGLLFMWHALDHWRMT
jgi:hypothetical protein